MPKSRRDKKVTLSKVQKKGAEKRTTFIEQIKTLIPKYSFLYVLKIANPRTNQFSLIRSELKDSKFLFGKNKLVAIALGRTASEEYRPGLHRVSRLLRGQCCLLLSNHEAATLRDSFNSFRSLEYARAGNKALQTVELVAGPMKRFAHTMEPQLRTLGLSVRLVRGVVTLDSDIVVCKRGSILTPEQCRILKLFEHQMSEFQVNILSVWDADSGSITDISQEDGCKVITSLPRHVRIKCCVLDDGQQYFVPQEVETDGEDEADDMEAEDGSE